MLSGQVLHLPQKSAQKSHPPLFACQFPLGLTYKFFLLTIITFSNFLKKYLKYRKSLSSVVLGHLSCVYLDYRGTYPSP